MPEAAKRWPIYLRTLVVAALSGLSGLLTYCVGPSFVDSSASVELADAIHAIGRAMMSASSMLCIVVVVLGFTNAFLTRSFTWTHGIVLAIASAVVFAESVVNAHPW